VADSARVGRSGPHNANIVISEFEVPAGKLVLRHVTPDAAAPAHGASLARMARADKPRADDNQQVGASEHDSEPRHLFRNSSTGPTRAMGSVVSSARRGRLDRFRRGPYRELAEIYSEAHDTAMVSQEHRSPDRGAFCVAIGRAPMRIAGLPAADREEMGRDLIR
jgi:hypothetical protein